nr:DNA primase [uncultured archaeon]
MVREEDPIGPFKVVVHDDVSGRGEYEIQVLDPDENILDLDTIPSDFYRQKYWKDRLRKWIHDVIEESAEVYDEVDLDELDFDDKWRSMKWCWIETFSEEEKERRRGKPSKPKKESVPAMEEERIKERALELLEDPGLLDKIRRTLTRGFEADGSYRFIEGEARKKLFTYLCFISARTPYPQFEWISGDPGSGKTNMASTVAEFFPEGYVQKVGYITGAGIRYLEDKDYEVLYVQEFRGQEEQDVRLTSIEDRGFKVIIAGRDQETGEMSAEEHFVPAKAFVTTSAEELPSDQLVRRTWLVSADESDSLTRKVNERIAEIAEGEAEPADDEWIEVLRAVPEQVEKKEVKIPYASEILEVTDWDRTNFKQFLRIVKIIACLHQRQREERDGEVVADIRDLYMAFRIAEEVLPETLFKLPKRLEETLDVIKDIEKTEVTKKEVAEELGKAGSTVYRYLEDLYNMGFVHKDGSGRENTYSPTEKSGLELSFSWMKSLDWSKCEKKVEEVLGENSSNLHKVSNPKEGFIMDDPVLKGRLLMSPSPDGKLKVEKIVSGGNDGSDLELSGEEIFLSEKKSLNRVLDGKSEEKEPEEVPDFAEPEGNPNCEICEEEMGIEREAEEKINMSGREVWACEKCLREMGRE